jgi:hypothetical protein
MGSEANWTPGTWTVNRYDKYCGWSIYAGAVGCIAERWYTIGRTDAENEQMMANAHLIAAAPDLYAALYDIRMSNAGTEQRMRGWDNAWEALKKARGEQ